MILVPHIDTRVKDIYELKVKNVNTKLLTSLY